MARKHYHVMNGNPGCYPDANDTYTSRRDAESAAADLVRDWRGDGERWKGSAKSGLYVRVPDGMYYVEIAECAEDCLDESDY